VGDEPYFHLQSNWLAEGFGFTVQPGSGVPSALHPPLTSLVLAPASWLASGDAVLGQRLALAVLGVATVVVIGLLGREVAGDRAGLLAAGIAALYPSLWVNDGIIMSESVTALLVASVLLGVYAYIRKPRMKLARLLGALCGLAP
jgi:4-amino-4-deoxy-L-arabinose transferase-like glycosyltransferase